MEQIEAERCICGHTQDQHVPNGDCLECPCEAFITRDGCNKTLVSRLESYDEIPDMDWECKSNILEAADRIRSLEAENAALRSEKATFECSLRKGRMDELEANNARLREVGKDAQYYLCGAYCEFSEEQGPMHHEACKKLTSVLNPSKEVPNETE